MTKALPPLHSIRRVPSSLAVRNDPMNPYDEDDDDDLECTTAEHLENLSAQLIVLKYSNNATKTRDHSNSSTQHRASSSSSDGRNPRLTNREKDPTTSSIEVVNTSSEVDEEIGEASVYVFFVRSGPEPKSTRECVVVLQWERWRFRWSCVRQTGLSGPAGFT